MNRDKQIEEIRKDLIEIFDEEYNKRRLITADFTAIHLVEKGYRKASDVAREIINEIADLMWQGESEKLNYSIGGRYYNKREFIAELKKKYESEGEE